MGGVLRLLALCALLVGLAAPAASASRASTTPDQWVAASLTAAKAASTVHITGVMSLTGQRLSLDLRLVAGKGASGRIVVGKQRIDIVQLGGFAYFRAGGGYWRHYGGSLAAELFAGRWVKVRTSMPGFSSFTSLTNMSSFFAGMFNSHGALSLGGTRRIGGTPAIGIIDSSQGGGTLWIASTGTPYPLRVTQTGGPGYIGFGSWDAPVKLTAPKNPVDLSKLKK